MKKMIYVLLAAGLFSLAGCSNTAFKDNKVYIANREQPGSSAADDTKLSTEGRIPFKEFNYPAIKDKGTPVTVSPDGKSVYMMQTAPGNEEKVIKGEEFTCADLIRYDLDTKKETVLEIAIPFISQAKWNAAGDKVAFLSKDRLHVYNTKTQKVEVDNQMRVTSFEWSPDGKKVYTEHPNLVNGSIMYVDTAKAVHAYENSEDLYFKGILDKDYYYATKRYLIESQIKKEMEKGKTKEEAEKLIKMSGKMEETKTVVTDKNRNIVKELPGGRFRDSYKRAMLQTSLEGFGLHYFPDINKNEERILTEEFIYDTKFIYGGKFIYITKGKDIEKNDFILYIADSLGKELKNLTISSSRMCISPDGKTGYGNGPGREVIDFERFISKGEGIESFNLGADENEEIYRAVRGAMDSYYRCEMVRDNGQENIGKYFINSSNPEQWGYFDVVTKIQQRSYTPNADTYTLHVFWNDYKVAANENKPYVRYSPMSDKPRASVNIGVSMHNSFGTGMGIEHELELVKEGGRWFVTGFSTFPYSAQARDMRNKAEQFVKEIQNKGLHGGVLKGKEVKVGQIQFWRLSEPHMSPDINSANFCKVYLKVMEDGKEVIYKMVLDKKYQNYWKINTIGKDNLSRLW